MHPALQWQEDVPSTLLATPKPSPARQSSELPAAVAAAIWNGAQFGSAVTSVRSSGFAELDAQLPGGGWPCRALTEILCPQSGVLEWRLLGPVLGPICRDGASVVLVGPPKQPHPPGLRHIGIDERLLLWIQAETPAERLWCAEQLIKTNACGALVAWLPQVRQEQIRRLQVLAAGCEAPVFICRPSPAARECSAAPLRIEARVGLDWELHIDILKRKGPPLERTLRLTSFPGGLQSILTPRLRYPSRLDRREPDHVVVSAAAPQHRHPSLAH